MICITEQKQKALLGLLLTLFRLLSFVVFGVPRVASCAPFVCDLSFDELLKFIILFVDVCLFYFCAIPVGSCADIRPLATPLHP